MTYPQYCEESAVLFPDPSLRVAIGVCKPCLSQVHIYLQDPVQNQSLHSQAVFGKTVSLCTLALSPISNHLFSIQRHPHTPEFAVVALVKCSQAEIYISGNHK